MDATGGERAAPIRVLIADDSALLVETLVAALAGHPVLEVAATALDGPGALDAVAACRPDVVLMDLRLGGDWGLDLLPAMLAGEQPPAVVVFSASTDDVAERAGVSAQLTKGVPLQEVFDTLEAAASRRAGTGPQS